MICETTGDLLEFPANIICHQVNYYGVMGGGIAYAIRRKVLSATDYQEYVDYCKFGKATLGSIQLLPRSDKDDGFVANLFSQADFSTDYNFLYLCLHKVELITHQLGFTVALPGNMGCGIAHGEWNKVMEVIQKVFGKSPVKLTIVWKNA